METNECIVAHTSQVSGEKKRKRLN